MNSIYEQLLFTTLRIESIKDGSQSSIGTGFLIQKQVDKNKFKIYLVSNRHVLADSNSIILSFTENNNGNPVFGKKITIPIGEVRNRIVSHYNPNIDVSVMECTGLFNLLPGKLFFIAVPYDFLADFSEPELSVAENVYFVGYPNDRYDEANNLPLIRTGLISSHPKVDFNGDPVFVIDAQVFPGSSGSPVYIDLSFENIKNGNIVLGGKKNIKLLGIVAQTMIRNNKLQAIPTGTTFTTPEVLGLGIVFKSTVIKELIDSL